MLTADVPQRAGNLIDAARDSLAHEIVARIYAGEPQAWEKYGQEGQRKAVEDAKFHLAYLAEALQLGEPRIFSDYVRWVAELFRNLRLPDNLMELTLDILLDVLRVNLRDGDFAATAEYIEEARAEAHAAGSEPEGGGGEALPPVARQFLYLLLDQRRNEAVSLIVDSVEQGMDIKEVYLRVLQPVLRETGRLWHRNEIDVSHEHYISSASEIVMSQVSALVSPVHRKDRHVLTTCIEGELHDIGLRMVTDFFELDGWYAYYVGANMPAESVVRAVVLQQPDVLAVSITMTYLLTEVQRLIAKVRQSEVASTVGIIVGGFPFAAFPGLWQRLGADGAAPDAEAAVALANEWMDRRQ